MFASLLSLLPYCHSILAHCQSFFSLCNQALDKILSVLPPDDPKTHALEQRANPTMLRQLVESNFSQRGMLLPERDMQSTFNDLAKIVKDTITMANNFTSEPTPKGSRSSAQQQELIPAKKESFIPRQESIKGAATSESSEHLPVGDEILQMLTKCE